VRYPQWLLLLMAILGILSGCRSARDLERFARRHREAFNTAFGLELGGTPTDSTFLYLLERVDLQSLFAMLRQWMLAQIAEQDRELDQLICDGKTLRGSASQPEVTLPSIYELQRRWRPIWKPASRRRMERRLSGKKSARGADLGTSQSLLRVEHYGLRDRQMAVIESCSEVED
jgi:hypothetical protein